MQETDITKNKVVIRMQAQLTSQATYIAGLEHDKRVTQYFSLTQKWTAVPGDPQELADQLATIHESVGEEQAKNLVGHYDRIQQSAQSVGLLTPLGTTKANFSARLGSGAKDDFHDEIEKYAADNKVDFAKALSHYAVINPKEFGEYRRRVKEALANN